MKEYFLTVIVACAFSVPLFAQGGMQQPTTLAAMLNQRYTQVKTSITNAANDMPEENYSFKATPAEMSFGEWIAHVADTQIRQCSTVNGEIKTVGAAQKTSKADLVAALKVSFDECDAAFGKLTDANALDAVGTGRGNSSRAGQLAYVTAHDNECYGSMAVYMRLKGIVPPSTAARGGGMGMGRGMSGGQGRGRQQ
jgi:uncharacterized damage-inducible protein DinB